MIYFTRQIFIRVFYVCIDLLFWGIAIFLACVLRPKTLPFEVSFFNIFVNPANPFRFLFLFWGLIIIFLNNAHGLYYTKREIFEPVEIWRVIRSVAISSFIVIMAIYLVKIEGFPRTVLVLGSSFMVFSFSLWRFVKRLIVNYLVVHGYNNFNVLVVGAGKVGKALVKEIQSRPELGLKIIGYLDDFKDEIEQNKGPQIIGNISDFLSISRREFINKVFITVHHDGKAFLRLLEQARELRVAVQVVPHGFELMRGNFSKYNIGFIPILEYCDSQLYSKQAGKRIFDFLAGLILLIIFSPVMLILMIIVKLDSSGPAFYLSKRYGRGGRIFNMYKFRSMTQDADKTLKTIKAKNEVDGPIFKMKKDPRITKVGRILRKYSLDELPQILNVFKGDMSLVGPRPLPIAQVEREDIRQLKRLEVRPGITGLWQIRGRSDISFKRLVRWDVWYINNWSFWLDFNILLQTIPVVIKGKGAY